MVLVEAGDGLPEAGDAVDRLGKADDQGGGRGRHRLLRALRGGPVRLSTQTLGSADLLEEIGRRRAAVAMRVFAEDGRVAAQRCESS
jgi:hypothetical protein